MLNIPILLLKNDVGYNAFINSLVESAASSPYILISLGLAYISGNLWACEIYFYYSKKERKILYSWIGKIGLGLLWFALVFLPIHIIVYKSIIINIVTLNELLITVLIVSFALQAIIYFLHRKERKK